MKAKGFIGSLIETVYKFGKQNLPGILTTAGLIAGGATVVIVYEKSPEAHKAKEEAVQKAKDEGKGKVGQTLAAAGAVSKVMWPSYITGAFATGCLIKSNMVSNDRIAALGAGYSFLEKRLEAMREAEKEVLGEKKAEDLKRKTYEKMMEKSNSDPDQPTDTKKQYAGLPQLYYDLLNDRFLRSDSETLRAAENAINSDVQAEYFDGSFDDDIGPNDFYRTVGWPETKGAQGWTFPPKSCFNHGEKGIHMILGKTSVVAPNGEPALVLDFENLAPRWGTRR